MKHWRAPFSKPATISQYAVGESTVMTRLTTSGKIINVQAWVEPQPSAPTFKQPQYVMVINDANMATGAVRPERFSPWSMLPAKARLMASEALACDPHDIYLDYRSEKKQLLWCAVSKTMVASMRGEKSLLAIEPASIAIMRGIRTLLPDCRCKPLMVLQPHSTQRFQCTIIQPKSSRPLHWCQQKPSACLQLAKQYRCETWIWIDPKKLLGEPNQRAPDWVPTKKWHQAPSIGKQIRGEIPKNWRTLSLHQLIIAGGGAMRRCPYGD